MSDNIHLMSAFAVYAAKRKSQTEQSKDSKKPKIRRLVKDTAASTQKSLRQANSKQALTKQKLKTEPETKTKKANNTNKIQQLNMNNNQNIHKIMKIQANKKKNEKNDYTDKPIKNSKIMDTNDSNVSMKNHVNPTTESAKVFKWLIFPQKVNSFIL